MESLQMFLFVPELCDIYSAGVPGPRKPRLQTKAEKGIILALLAYLGDGTLHTLCFLFISILTADTLPIFFTASFSRLCISLSRSHLP